MAFHLIRHLEPDGARGLCYGRRDLECDPAVIEAAAASIRARLPAPVPGELPIFTSPLSRCRALARALAAPGSPRVAEELIELDFGDWEGRRWDALPPRELDDWARDVWGYRPGGRESAAMLEERWVRWSQSVAPRGDETVIAVTHAGVIRAALAAGGSLPYAEAARASIAFGSVCVIGPPAATSPARRGYATP